MFHTVICDLLGIKYPILQGAMQGGGGVELAEAARLAERLPSVANGTNDSTASMRRKV